MCFKISYSKSWFVSILLIEVVFLQSKTIESSVYEFDGR